MEKELLQLLADQAGCIFLSDLHDPDKIELFSRNSASFAGRTIHAMGLE